MKTRLRRYYLLMTSLALAAGASLGYYTGQGSAQVNLANECIESGIFVVYDAEALAHRHFHCFELDGLEEPEDQEQQRVNEYEV